MSIAHGHFYVMVVQKFLKGKCISLKADVCEAANSEIPENPNQRGFFQRAVSW